MFYKNQTTKSLNYSLNVSILSNFSSNFFENGNIFYPFFKYSTTPYIFLDTKKCFPIINGWLISKVLIFTFLKECEMLFI